MKCFFYVLKRIGSSSVIKKVWDKEFSNGKWDYLDTNPEQIADQVYHLIKKYCNKGNILELGCGSGKTGLEMDSKDYTHYHGVDISEVAIKKAMSLVAGYNDRYEKNSFVVGDICGYVPETQYNIILFRESLYYLNRFAVRKVLYKYRNYLKDDGVIIVRISDRRRYKGIIKFILRTFTILDEYESNNSAMMIVAFR